jgi:acetyl-CoA acyltransferase 1
MNMHSSRILVQTRSGLEAVYHTAGALNALQQASSSGIFAEEILPIEMRGTVISIDDTIRPGVSAESLASLKPSFPQWGPGSTTAGNASGIGDGAGICVLTTRERAEREGMEIVGKWVASSVVGEQNDR